MACQKRTDTVSAGFQSLEVAEETTFGDYKDFDGIKKASKIERRRDGEKFLEQEIIDFKVLDEVPTEIFSEPR